MADTQTLAQIAYLIASTQVKPTWNEYQNSGVNTGDGGVNFNAYVQSRIVEKACDLLDQSRLPDPASKGFPYIMDNLMSVIETMNMRPKDPKDKKGAPFKEFTSIIESVVLDERSQRCVVQFAGAPTSKNPDGRETAYTDRIDGYQANGLLVANRAQALIGHKVHVMLHVEVMANKGGNKARTIKHIRDMGMPKPEDYLPRNNGQQGQQSQGGFANGQQGQQPQSQGGFANGQQGQSQGGFANGQQQGWGGSYGNGGY